VRLVSAALTGSLGPHVSIGKPGNKGHEEKFLSDGQLIAKGVQKLSVGTAFLVISLCVMMFAPAGHIWWFWMLIPAFTLIGKGIAPFVELKHRGRMSGSAPSQVATPAPQPSLEERRQFELSPPPSVTETTTRHLEYDAPRRESER
jgi:hypothetical protein